MKYLSRRKLALLPLLVIIAIMLVVSPVESSTMLFEIRESRFFILLLFLLYLVRPFLGFPPSLLSAFVGFNYGILYGVPIALIGAVTTALPVYSIGVLSQVNTGLLGEIRASTESVLEETGKFKSVLLATVSPAPADAVSYSAGLSDISPTKFITATFVGEIPWVTAYVFAGYSMAQFSVTGITTQFAPLAFGLLIIVGVLSKRYICG